LPSNRPFQNAVATPASSGKDRERPASPRLCLDQAANRRAHLLSFDLKHTDPLPAEEASRVSANSHHAQKAWNDWIGSTQAVARRAALEKRQEGRQLARPGRSALRLDLYSQGAP
jgi:hypothetical protein